MKKSYYIGLILLVVAFAQNIFASSESDAHGLSPTVMLGVASILLISTLFGELFERIGQPAVLGEIVAGIILGNLFLFGITFAESLKTNEIIEALAQIGVIILLFEVGLETNLKDMIKVGGSSFLVALIGVVVPFFLGWLVASIFLPNNVTLSHIFIGAMLTATSIGITARVLRDLGYLNDRVAQIILGAAVIDDVLALLMLGIVDGAIEATALGTSLLVTDYVIIAVKAIAFLVGAVVIGQFLAPRIFRSVQHFESRSVVIGISIAFCFLTAFVASQVGLAAIIGAFAAGLILEEIHFEDFDDKHTYNLEHFLAPVSALLAPIFFISIGLKVDLRAFAEPSLLYFAICLTAVAIFGKLVCALGVREKGVSKWAVGFGMVPRGEGILFFASYGTSLMLTDLTGTKNPVIEPSTFSAVVICVMVSTLITPPLLKYTLGKKEVE